MQKIFTFSRNALKISGNVDVNSCQLKNCEWISDQPGELTTRNPSSANATTVLTSAAMTARRPSLRFRLVSGPA
jgi:hypothetical protein